MNAATAARLETLTTIKWLKNADSASYLQKKMQEIMDNAVPVKTKEKTPRSGRDSTVEYCLLNWTTEAYHLEAINPGSMLPIIPSQ